jgi:hypothetical protein
MWSCSQSQTVPSCSQGEWTGISSHSNSQHPQRNPASVVVVRPSPPIIKSQMVAVGVCAAIAMCRTSQKPRPCRTRNLGHHFTLSAGRISAW